MEVAVLSPENCLRDGFSHPHRRLISPPRSKPRRSSATNIPNPAQSRSGRRRQQWSPAGSPSPPSSPPQTKPSNDGKAYRAKSPAATGQVRILKRGEDFVPTKQPTTLAVPVKNRKTKREGSLDREDSGSVASSPDRLSPDPVPAPSLNPLLSGFYAGSGFFTSPPPSSLPLPAFCTKNIGAGAGGLTKCSAEDAAVDLRRILRLE